MKTGSVLGIILLLCLASCSTAVQNTHVRSARAGSFLAATLTAEDHGSASASRTGAGAGDPMSLALMAQNMARNGDEVPASDDVVIADHLSDTADHLVSNQDAPVAYESRPQPHPTRHYFSPAAKHSAEWDEEAQTKRQIEIAAQGMDQLLKSSDAITQKMTHKVLEDYTDVDEPKDRAHSEDDSAASAAMPSFLESVGSTRPDAVARQILDLARQRDELLQAKQNIQLELDAAAHEEKVTGIPPTSDTEDIDAIANGSHHFGNDVEEMEADAHFSKNKNDIQDLLSNTDSLLGRVKETYLGAPVS